MENFRGRTYQQTGWEARTVRFADGDRGAVATCTYSYKLTSAQRAEMARRIAAALNLVTHMTTDQIESCAPIAAPADDALTGALKLLVQIAVKTQPAQVAAD